MTKVIAIAHEKGGVGKTTTTINLGIGLARQGKNVLLVDADPQGDLTKCLGVKELKALRHTIASCMDYLIAISPILFTPTPSGSMTRAWISSPPTPALRLRK